MKDRQTDLGVDGRQPLNRERTNVFSSLALDHYRVDGVIVAQETEIN